MATAPGAPEQRAMVSAVPLETGRFVAVAVAGLLVLSSAAFAFGGGAGRPEPVAFEDTVLVSPTSDVAQRAAAAGVVVPRAEIFYSQYRYVVGVHGIGAAVGELDSAARRRQFGEPLAVYVSDFSGRDVRVGEEGSVSLPGDRSPGWVAATEAWFVVESEARTAGEPAVMPFSDRHDAVAFATVHGGEVVDWAAVRAREFDTAAATRDRMQTRVTERAAWANRTARAAADLRDRPVSVVVGEDEPTVSDALAAAPANTTVVVPEGTYRVDEVTVDRPLTIRGAGEGTHLVGDGNGSVLRVTAPAVAVVDLRISGIGANLTSESVPVDEEAWDYQIQQGYAFAPAGVEMQNASGSLVAGVAIETPAHGVVVRESDDTVVTDVTVDGADVWDEGFMGTIAIQSRILVQDSEFVGGRDAVYLHRGHDSVVRGNRMAGMRFGVHEMYTDGVLVADNDIRDTNAGVVVMTDPSATAIVGNDVRDSERGVDISGVAQYVAGNVLAFNEVGIRVGGQRSLVERNVVAYNDVGAKASALVPSNRVVANDFAANDRPVDARVGPLHIWGGDRRGNYWAGAPGYDSDGDGTLDRPFDPSGRLDQVAGHAAGGPTLARAPAVGLLRSLREVTPGLRSTGVMDYHPRARPVHPGRLDRLHDQAEERGVAHREVSP
jgi:nitrous oxidase accessory protein NosD